MARAIAELAGLIATPAPHAAVVEDGAGMRSSDRDLNRGAMGRQDRGGPRLVGPGPIAELAVPVVSPTENGTRRQTALAHQGAALRPRGGHLKDAPKLPHRRRGRAQLAIA